MKNRQRVMRSRVPSHAHINRRPLRGIAPRFHQQPASPWRARLVDCACAVLALSLFALVGVLLAWRG